jgi:hypothetical protein
MSEKFTFYIPDTNGKMHEVHFTAKRLESLVNNLIANGKIILRPGDAIEVSSADLRPVDENTTR